MSRTSSPSANRPYGLARVCRVWRMARSSVYAALGRAAGSPAAPARKRGPAGACTDEQLLAHVRRIIAATVWVLWLRRFATVEELNAALQAFRERYNREWLIQRHGWVSPSVHHKRLAATEAAA